MGILLSILAQGLFVFVSLINFPLVVIKYIKKHGFLKVWDEYWFQDALSLDIYGNYRYRTTWNMCFKTKGGYEFGVLGETISSALGKNQRDRTLTWVGWAIVYILWAIDYKYWEKGGHCINSIVDKISKNKNN